MRVLFLAGLLAAAAAPALAAGMTATTPDFQTGGTLPKAQVCDREGGGNRSPALAWSDAPAGTQSFAVTMFDPDAGGGRGFWHWTVFNIPAATQHLAAGAGGAEAHLLPPGAVQGANGKGQAGYLGACPPPGPAHHYQITVYALRIPALSLPASAAPAEIAATLRSNAVATAQIIALYGQSR